MEPVADWALLVVGPVLVVVGFVIFGLRYRLAVWQRARNEGTTTSHSGVPGPARISVLTEIFVAIMFVAVGAGMTVTSALRLWP